MDHTVVPYTLLTLLALLFYVVWQFGVAVTALGVSTKLLYIEPG